MHAKTTVTPARQLRLQTDERYVNMQFRIKCLPITFVYKLWVCSSAVLCRM